jgi:flagellar protein FlaG
MYACLAMANQSQQQNISLKNASDYREAYANSVQVRVSVWDFLLIFGVATPEPDQLKIENHQGIFLSPQQAKALWNVLGQNLAQYEETFGQLALEPMPTPQGPIH